MAINIFQSLTGQMKSPAIFLTTQWRYLAMLNYEIDPEILALFVPSGTELDFWNGKTYVSLVGFLFQDTHVAGIPIPFHRHFEEINLRFYVRRKAEDGWRRGVVFIKELVPRRAIAFIAKTFYNENYFALPMSHRIEKVGDEIKSVSYGWRFNGRENFLKVTVRGQAQPLVENSLQEFITERYWVMRRSATVPRKNILSSTRAGTFGKRNRAEFHRDVAELYGEHFCEFLNRSPSSAFLADGSKVKVYKDVKLPSSDDSSANKSD